MKPVIAIPEMGDDLFRKYMKSKYVNAIHAAGATVRWIEWDQTEEVAEIARKFDGLLLPGGADIEPTLYSREREEKCGAPHIQRDKLEPLLLKAFLDLDKPVLGICRGMQMMNVYFGGTLYQDIKDMSNVNHSDFLKRKKGNHTVKITEGSRLHSILSAKEIPVNSLHHQAAYKIGKGLVISAVSKDGITEAVENPDYKFCLGVQWHPEHMAANNKAQQNIFDEFIKHCNN